MGTGGFYWTTTSTTSAASTTTIPEAEDEEWEFSPEDFVESEEPCINHQAWPEGDVLSAKDTNEIFSRLSMLEDSVYPVS